MGGMVVPVMNVVDVVTVPHWVVAAAGLVSVVVLGVGCVRQRMLVVVALMRGVRMAIVYIIDMSVMPDAGVAAVRAVLVRVLRVDSVGVGSHRSPVIVDRSMLGPNAWRFCPVVDWDKQHRNSPGSRKVALVLERGPALCRCRGCNHDGSGPS